MDSRSESLALRTTACGVVARRLLREGGYGRVAVVFEKSFYIRSNDGVACIGNESLPSCPLNVITDARRDMDWRARGLLVDMRWMILGSTIHLDRGLRIRFGDARTWQPVRAPRGWRHQDLHHAVATLRRLAETRVPDEGFGMLSLACPHSATKRPLTETAREPVERLSQWLIASARGCCERSSAVLRSVRALTGLGPGLTPSGDDFLAGMMIALQAFGYEDISQALWHTVRPWALETGNIISFAHLSAASEGQGSAAIHGLLGALQTGDCSDMGEHLNNIDEIGHTSGWDALAGVVTVADVLLRLEHERHT